MKTVRANLWIRNLLYSTVMLAIWLVYAGQANAATPKSVSVVHEDNIRLADVFDGIVTHGDHVLAPAPKPGAEMTLGPQSLNRIARAFNLDWRASTVADQTVIKRAATTITHEQVMRKLESALSEKISGAFELEVYNRKLSLTLPSTMSASLAVESVNYDPLRGDFSATLVVAPNDVNSRQIGISGEAYRLTEVPVLTRRLRAGDVISARDLEWIEMRSAQVSKNVLLKSDELIGMSPKRFLNEGQPVRASEVQLPVVVSRGDVVTMILKTRVMSLTAQGKALNDGAEGETVRIKNTTSNQIVEAVVVGPQKVSVVAPQNRLVN